MRLTNTPIFAFLLITFTSTFTLQSCVISDDDTPEPEVETSLFLLSSNIEQIWARRTCESDGSSGKADIYARVRISHRTAEETDYTTLIESGWKLHELGLNDVTFDPQIAASAVKEIADGDIIAFELGF